MSIIFGIPMPLLTLFSAVEVTRPHDRLLVIEKKTDYSWPAVLLVGMLVYAAFQTELPWDVSEIVQHIRNRFQEEPLLWVVAVVFLVSLKVVLSELGTLVWKEKFTLNGVRSELMKNDERLAHFREMAEIKIKKEIISTRDNYPGNDTWTRVSYRDQDAYRLSIMLNSGKGIELHWTDDVQDIMKLAGEISNLTNIPIRRAGFETEIRNRGGCL